MASSVNNFSVGGLLAYNTNLKEISYTTGTIPATIPFGFTIIRITGAGASTTALPLPPSQMPKLLMFANDATGDLTLTQSVGGNIVVVNDGGAILYADKTGEYHPIFNGSGSSAATYPFCIDATGQAAGSTAFCIWNAAGTGIQYTIAEDGEVNISEQGGNHQVRIDGQIPYVKAEEGGGGQDIQLRCEGTNDAQLNIFDNLYDRQPVYAPERAFYRYGIERGIFRNANQRTLNTHYGFPQGTFGYSAGAGSYGNVSENPRTLAVLTDGVNNQIAGPRTWKTETAWITAGQDACFNDGLQIRGKVSGTKFEGIEIPADYSRGILEIKVHLIGDYAAGDVSNNFKCEAVQRDAGGVLIHRHEISHNRDGLNGNHFQADGAIVLYANALGGNMGGLTAPMAFTPTNTFDVEIVSNSVQLTSFSAFTAEYRLFRQQ